MKWLFSLFPTKVNENRKPEERLTVYQSVFAIIVCHNQWSRWHTPHSSLLPSSQVTQSQSRGRRNIFLVNFIKIFWPFLQLYWFCHRLGRTWIEIIGANNQQLVSFMTLRGFYFWHSSIKLFKFSVDYLNMKIRNIMDHGFACQLILCCLNLQKKENIHTKDSWYTI